MIGMTRTVKADAGSPWAAIIYDALRAANVRQATYVPDAGHATLIDRLRATPDIRTTVLTTEEEGVAMAAGAWLGGQRSVLLMQSSGVGNCLNMLSLIANCRMPFLTIVTMRGEFAEFNPWQVPMGRATEQAFKIMGVATVRVDRLDELEGAMASATTMAFDGDQAIAVILSQKLLGRKTWIAK
jgi:sulfopyruvate decarboxylase alpha subunit